MVSLPKQVSHMALPKLRSPVVLVHGLLGFDQIRLAGMTMADYFPGISTALKLSGNDVYIPCLHPTRGVADRAVELKKYLDQVTTGEPVHLIAHSLGGLDSRFMISHLGMEDRVLSLTTLGTPHHGTAFADWGIRNLGRLLKPVLDFIGIPYGAFYDLTTANCRRFNEAVPNAPEVRYFSVAGEFGGHWHRPEWLLPSSIVWQAEGPNDGVVSVKSARHGEMLTTWRGDHFSLINWAHFLAPSRVFANGETTLFQTILRRLADEGY
jgi:triacylglycerol lipase